jgi:hypothetical protein
MMKRRPWGRYKWLFTFVAASLLPLGALTACKTPPIGVQDYGTVIGTVYDAKSRLPLTNVLVNIGSLLSGYTDGQGHFSIPHVPIGIQTVHVTPPGGYGAVPDEQIDVQKDATVPAPAFGLTSS